MPSLTYSAGLFIFQTCKPPENDGRCLSHPLCGEMPQAVAGDQEQGTSLISPQDIPALTTGPCTLQLRHPRPPRLPPHSLCHSTLKTCTKTSLLPAGMSSSLAVQFLNQNYQLLPPHLHHLLLDLLVGNRVMVVALRESLSPSPSAPGAGISSLPHQLSRPDWLHGECHLVASRCITSPAIITVPWALMGDGTTSSCLYLKSGGASLCTLAQRELCMPA